MGCTSLEHSHRSEGACRRSCLVLPRIHFPEASTIVQIELCERMNSRIGWPHFHSQGNKDDAIDSDGIDNSNANHHITIDINHARYGPTMVHVRPAWGIEATRLKWRLLINRSNVTQCNAMQSMQSMKQRCTVQCNTVQ